MCIFFNFRFTLTNYLPAKLANSSNFRYTDWHFHYKIRMNESTSIFYFCSFTVHLVIWSQCKVSIRRLLVPNAGNLSNKISWKLISWCLVKNLLPFIYNFNRELVLKRKAWELLERPLEKKLFDLIIWKKNKDLERSIIYPYSPSKLRKVRCHGVHSVRFCVTNFGQTSILTKLVPRHINKIGSQTFYDFS